MNEDDFLASIKCELVPALDEDGEPIPKLHGLYFRPLDVADMLAVHEYVEKAGKGGAFRLMFVRALRNADGSRVLSDSAADKLATDVLAGPIGLAIPVIRRISGQVDDSEKKAPSTDGPT